MKKLILNLVFGVALLFALTVLFAHFAMGKDMPNSVSYALMFSMMVCFTGWFNPNTESRTGVKKKKARVIYGVGMALLIAATFLVDILWVGMPLWKAAVHSVGFSAFGFGLFALASLIFRDQQR